MTQEKKTRKRKSRAHVGQWIITPSGNVGHVLADPDMSEETRNALMALIDAAHKYAEEKADGGKTGESASDGGKPEGD